ncbi:MAG: hypothetical protein FWC56_06055, partial [Phycisphaerae bacterium]|nr:hypothetical protein [Phycisphaerae bacterium]
MRVCWLVRENLLEQPGGDTTQILQTAEALRRSGAGDNSDVREPITIDFVSSRRPDFAGYDLVHLFHLDRLWENEPHCRQLQAQRRPAVLSTIYWPADAFDRGGRAGLQGLLARAIGSEGYRSLRLLQRWALDLRRAFRQGGVHRPTWNFRRSARYCLETMSVLLPNSRAEQEVIEAELDVQRPTVVVPNAVGQEFLQTPAGCEDVLGAASSTPVRQGVLCVGRIEPRKNQLALIRAVRKSDIRLTLIG